MQRATKVSRRARRWTVGIAFGAASILTVPMIAPADRDTEPPNVVGSGSSDFAATGRAGQLIQVDPRTGARVAPSAPIAGTALNPAFSTSHKGLVEQAAPGGGVMIDLQGRFRSAATATVGTDGKPAVDCVPPGGAAREEQRP